MSQAISVIACVDEDRRTPVSRLTAYWVAKCFAARRRIHHARRRGEKTAIPPTQALALPVHEAQSGVGSGFSLPRPSVPDEQSAHCAVQPTFFAGRFWFYDHCCSAGWRNAHRSCDTTDGRGAFAMNSTRVVGTYSAGASSKKCVRP